MNTTSQLLQELQRAIEGEREYYTCRLVRLEKENEKLRQQQPKIGHWVEGTCTFYCSNCKYEPYNLTNYCPNCGAKMAETQIR